MDFEPKYQTIRRKVRYQVSDRESIEITDRKPLEILRDTEGLIRRQAVAAIVPVVSQPLAAKIESASEVAEDSLSVLAEIDLDAISDVELQPARILVGLSFVGFGALAIALLTLFIYTLHPQLSHQQQIHQYWYPYVFFVSLGVTGLLTIGREIMRVTK
ncbi:hypothetical protein [Chroococcidiopsis sp.]|uniref:hypothetical protein n=1 Tax=Chroococcidiopsis sp. TaxID=3088168 RepID=UPI003F338E34